MKTLQSKIIAIGAAGLAASICASQANADAIATSYLEITGLVFSDASTGTALTISDLGLPAVPATTGTATATLNGVSDTNTTGGTAGGVFDLNFSDNGYSGYACEGDCAYTNFDITTLPGGSPSFIGAGGTPPGGSYALMDVGQAGIVVGTGGAGPIGASAFTLAEAAVIPGTAPGNEGNVAGNVGLTAEFSIISSFTGNINVAYGWEQFIRAALIDPNDPGSEAKASSRFSVSFNNLTTGEQWSTSLSGDAGTFVSEVTPAPALGFDDISFSRSGSVSKDTSSGIDANFFDDGDAVTVTITHSSEANATSVPVPATLALFGVGLLGFGAAARRKQKN